MKCPAGHETTATDYCDTCGIAMDAAAADAPVDTPPVDDGPDAAVDTGALPTTEAVPAPGASGECPSCQTVNPANALFCENCGYDFTTGSMPRPVEPPASSLDLGSADSGDPVDPVVPATPATPATPAGPAASGNPSPAPAETWVAEIWIDPDWYDDQESTDPLPSPGVPTVVALRHTSILIGRSSRSRGIHPDLDLDNDNGSSRRHAQLTTDGTRWFVEDLGSSNGTYVGGGSGMLPKTAITVGQKVEITGGDRVYLGAWTRIVLRKAAPGEV